MKRRYPRLLAAALFLLAVPCVAHAQTSCTDALAQAEKLYDLGQFEDVVTEIQPCLAAKLSRATAIQVHSLLARAWLYDDQPEKASKEVSTLLRLDSAFDAGASGRFAALVAKVKREEQTTQVISVSKTSESLREAPATVVVVTGDEIERRGYIDLEQLLHDLPGFDIARINGDIYSTIYQRGYFGPLNDRLLLLVDGVEQNDLTQGTVYLSRQYPLTNIDRVEVIYGPASTMYGANAYTGVISIVTKEPEALTGENKRFGITGQVTEGGYGTRGADVTVAGTDGGGTVAWSLAGQFQTAKERNLSNFDEWDYTYRNFDYKTAMRLEGTPDERAALCTLPSPYIDCSKPSSIELTDAGVDFVRGLDRALIQDNGLGFNDRSKNWALNGKLRIANLTIGLQSWRSQEGIVSAYGAQQGLAGNTFFTPEETAIYLKYQVPLARVKLNVFTRYLQTTIDRSTSRFDILHNYSGGFLSLWSLVPPCRSPFDQHPVSCSPAAPWVEKVVYGGLSTQLRNEISLAWEPSEKVSGVAGLEFVKSSIQSQYDQTTSGPGDLIAPMPPIEHNEHTDAAVWAQGSWKPRRSLRFIAAGRAGYNEINNRPGVNGFGFIFTPRIGVIYMPGDRSLVLKAIYSEAFKDPTDTEKFGLIISGAMSNPALHPERVRNLELSAGWEPVDRIAVQGSLYQAHYTNVVDFGLANPPDISTLQEQNRDEIRVRGLEASARYKLAAAEIWANYTHTQPVQTVRGLRDNRISNVRVADIAANQMNVGIESSWHRLSATLRAHYSGLRKTGDGTTFHSPFEQMDAFSTTAVGLSYRDLMPGTTLQLIVNNLFNKNYYDGGSDFVLPRVLQSGRTIHLRLVYRSEKGGAEPSPR